MAAGYFNINIEAGATFSTIIEINDTNDVSLDLTGATGISYIRKSYYSNIDQYALTVEILSPPTDGRIKLSATAEETAEFPGGRYVYDVEVYDGTSVNRLLEGIAIVKPSSSSQYIWGSTGATGI